MPGHHSTGDSAPIVIVGSGYAGISVAEAIRRHDAEREVIIVTADSGERYYKPNLSNALSRGKTPEGLVTEDAEALAEGLGVRLIAQTHVTAIDRRQRCITTNSGDYRYGALVLAQGAEPAGLRVAGSAAGRVLSINDLDDYRRFRGRLNAEAHVAIIGTGLIGCELANDLVKAGHGVSLVGLNDWPLDRLLPESAGRRLQRALAENGVVWYLREQLTHIEHSEDGYRIHLAGDRELKADLVLSAIGLEPRIALARDAGLHTGHGIVADACMRTSDSSIYAIGDCVELDGQLLPYIAPITAAADSVAAGVLGEPKPVVFPPMPVIVKTTLHPIHALVPNANLAGHWELDEGAEGLRCLFYDDANDLAGFVLTGRRVRERPKLLEACTAARPPSPAIEPSPDHLGTAPSDALAGQRTDP